VDAAALRLARRHHLPWQELDALHAHVALDQAEGTGHGWGSKADALLAHLVSPGLDPDPLATTERRAAEERATEPWEALFGRQGGSEEVGE
jgi:hypothetical protein